MRRYLLIVGFIIIVFFGIVLLWPKGNKDDKKKDTETVQPADFVDYAHTDAQATMTIDGRTSAEETRRSIQIAVNRNLATITVYKGYQGEVLKQQSYTNNENSFKAFLYSLKNYNFTATKDAPKNATEQGSCALGQRYIYELTEGSDTKLHSWGTSCSKALGTYDGDAASTRRLFRQQIPNYDDIVHGIQL